MKHFALFAILLFSAFFMPSCRRDLNESIQSAEDNSQIETEYSEIYEAVADFASTDPKTAKTDDYFLPSGAVISFEDSTFNDGDGVDFTINYGPLDHDSTFKGMLCRDGRYRSGVIHAGLDKRWSENGSKLTIAISAADAYYVGNGTNMYKLSGTKTITRSTATTYQVVVSDAKLQRDNGEVSWNAQRTITLTNDAPLGWWNDEYQITGTASGINAAGEPFTVTTTVPLQKRLAFGCLSTFVAGELKLTNSNGRELTINYDTYGNQACDKVVTVTYNGRSRNITLW